MFIVFIEFPQHFKYRARSSVVEIWRCAPNFAQGWSVKFKTLVFFQSGTDIMAFHVSVVFARVAYGAFCLLKYNLPAQSGVRKLSVFYVRAFNGSQRAQIFVDCLRV